MIEISPWVWQSLTATGILIAGISLWQRRYLDAGIGAGVALGSFAWKVL